MIRVCQVCGAEFSCKPAQVRLRNGGKFCSVACKAIAQREVKGPAHPNWKGEDVGEPSGRSRARRTYVADACQRCGATANLDRHHRDTNTRNNAPENVVVLCRRCHMQVDGRATTLSHATDIPADLSREIARRYAELPRAGSRCVRGSVEALAAELGVCSKTIRNHARKGSA